MNTKDHHEGQVIAEQAAEWVHRLKTATRDERMEFTRWLKQSPHHVRETLLAITWHQVVRYVDLDRRWNVDALAAAASNTPIALSTGSARTHRGDSRPTHLLPEMPKIPEVSSSVPWKRAAAAALAIIVPMAVGVMAIWSDRTLETQLGEWHTQTLVDGTIVRIGPTTKLHVAFGDDRRFITLSRGEAAFDVAKDPRRPFIVETDRAVTRALGTRFGVACSAAGTTVTVAEGTVVVARMRSPWPRPEQRNPRDAGTDATVTLLADEQVAITEKSALVVRPVTAAVELAWAEGVLVVNRTSAFDAVGEFNRRNRPQIRIHDRELGLTLISGRYRLSDPEGFARALAKLLEASVRAEVDGSLVIEAASRDERLSL